jgi:hypothetical protein
MENNCHDLGQASANSERIVGQPDITCSSNINFRAVVLEKRGFE